GGRRGGGGRVEQSVSTLARAPGWTVHVPADAADQPVNAGGPGPNEIVGGGRRSRCGSRQRCATGGTKTRAGFALSGAVPTDSRTALHDAVPDIDTAPIIS